MNLTKGAHHTLPGGGVKDGESLIDAVKRESMEETGANIDVGRDIGMIIEYRNKLNIIKISYCYLAKQVGELVTPKLEQDEIDEDYKLMWVTLEEAIALFRQDRPATYKWKMAVMRELKFLQKAMEIINNKAES